MHPPMAFGVGDGGGEREGGPRDKVGKEKEHVDQFGKGEGSSSLMGVMDGVCMLRRRTSHACPPSPRCLLLMFLPPPLAGQCHSWPVLPLSMPRSPPALLLVLC